MSSSYSTPPVFCVFVSQKDKLHIKSALMVTALGNKSGRRRRRELIENLCGAHSSRWRRDCSLVMRKCAAVAAAVCDQF